MESEGTEMSDTTGQHPGTNQISERFENWWNDEGGVIQHDTEAGRKHATWIAWHNGAYCAIGIVDAMKPSKARFRMQPLL
jgi:hypothetical protein